jgi:tetratricopeptide (TPR) repeat protein
VARRHVGCDRCGAGAWIGPASDHDDAWCEACQRAALVPKGDREPTCSSCGQSLTLGAPRFEELFGQLQDLVAVLEAWNGDPARLATLVPDRPRFLTDLNPPAPRVGDPPEVRAALLALSTGAFREARLGLEGALVDPAATDPARLAFALGIACQRLGELVAAEAAFDRALALDREHSSARLDRGALRARRGDLAAAGEDWDRAGDGREARWNRAALLLHEAVSRAPGFPASEAIAAARQHAGPASSFWSDHTVGRLLFTLLVERARARGVSGDAACADARALRAAVQELEFDTFDDRALVLHGFAALGLPRDAQEVGAPLAAALLSRLATEPFARGPAGRWLADALDLAAVETRAARPAGALAVLSPLLARDDVKRYRFPCARCPEGTVGVEQVEDERPTPASEGP